VGLETGERGRAERCLHDPRRGRGAGARAQSHVPFAHHGVANNRTSPWAAHFVVSNVNKELAGADGYTYDLEWSPDAINPPINQRVRGVPPTYIEYAACPTHCASIKHTAYKA